MGFFLPRLSSRRQFEHSIANSILSRILKGTFPSLPISPCLPLPTDAFALWNLLSTPPYLWSRMEKTKTTRGRQPYPIYPCTQKEWERQLDFLFVCFFYFLFFGGEGLVGCGEELWGFVVGGFFFSFHFYCSLKVLSQEVTQIYVSRRLDRCLMFIWSIMAYIHYHLSTTFC